MYISPRIPLQIVDIIGWLTKLFPKHVARIRAVRILRGCHPAMRGLYDPDSRTIYLNLNCRDVIGTFFHEFGHHVYTEDRLNGSQEIFAENFRKILTKRLKVNKDEVL